jgi:hypothetical protein
MLIVGGLAGCFGSIGVFVLHLGWWIVGVCAVVAAVVGYSLERVQVVSAPGETQKVNRGLRGCRG